MESEEKMDELNDPWKKPWNKDDLESVDVCPVCKSQPREKLYRRLKDIVFRVAPGHWDLYKCKNCTSAYLDPRPTESTIGKAYKSYYTHSVAKERDEPSQLGWFRLFRRALVNGYLNHRYGTQYRPASKFGSILTILTKSQRAVIDVQFRWLPKPLTGQRLLDVGAGGGEFLVRAADAGWDAVGVDPDSVAVEKAKKRKLNVYLGGIDSYSASPESFDAITISHVIEHVHDPIKVLNEAYELLSPGGVLYLDTPNIESHGHRKFGRYWLHLDSPRHLVIFSRKSIRELLYSVGFIDVQFIDRPAVSKSSYMSSVYLLNRNNIPVIQDSASLKWKSYFFSAQASINRCGVEHLTLLAKKSQL